ncbi:hypothetical protein [Pantoea ananatis]|nr:hypothetical protein [Pantoea ananatis]
MLEMTGKLVATTVVATPMPLGARRALAADNRCASGRRAALPAHLLLS